MRLAKIYAQALYETVRSNGSTDKALREQTDGIDAILNATKESKELKIALFSPATSSKDKIAIIETLGKGHQFPPLLVQFLTILAKKGRLPILPQIREALDQVRVEADGGVLGQVVTAEEVDESELTSLAKAFSEQLGKNVEFKVKQDADLLAGLKVTVNGTTYDGSLRAQLDQLKHRFIYSDAGVDHAN